MVRSRWQSCGVAMENRSEPLQGTHGQTYTQTTDAFTHYMSTMKPPRFSGVKLLKLQQPTWSVTILGHITTKSI